MSLLEGPYGWSVIGITSRRDEFVAFLQRSNRAVIGG